MLYIIDPNSIHLIGFADVFEAYSGRAKLGCSMASLFRVLNDHSLERRARFWKLDPESANLWEWTWYEVLGSKARRRSGIDGGAAIDRQGCHGRERANVQEALMEVMPLVVDNNSFAIV